jgi:hypothetical protein
VGPGYHARRDAGVAGLLGPREERGGSGRGRDMGQKLPSRGGRKRKCFSFFFFYFSFLFSISISISFLSSFPFVIPSLQRREVGVYSFLFFLLLVWVVHFWSLELLGSIR